MIISKISNYFPFRFTPANLPKSRYTSFVSSGGGKRGGEGRKSNILLGLEIRGEEGQEEAAWEWRQLRGDEDGADAVVEYVRGLGS